MWPLAIGAFLSGRGHESNYWEWIAPGIGVLTGFFTIAGYWTTRFDIEPEHVVYKSGWIFRRDRRIPLEQIQNVNLRQNLLERLFKVATVDVETAMGKGRDLKLSVLSLADAERFREELLEASHLEGAKRILDEKPFVQMTKHDLMLGALTENHLMQTLTVIGPLGGSAVYLQKFASKFSPTAQVGALLGGVLLVVVGCWLYGALMYYLKYGGFTVWRTPNVFRIKFGLLNREQLAIRPSRIEYVHLTSTIPQRLMDRASVFLGTAATFGEAGVLAPVALFVDRRIAGHAAADVIKGLEIPALQWRPFHPVFYWRTIARVLVWDAVLTALLIWLLTLPDAPSLVLSIIYAGSLIPGVLRICGLLLARPENGYAITDDVVVVRQGYFHQSISAIPIPRIENIAMGQPWWWKRRRAINLHVQAMKQRIHIPAVPEAAVEELLTRWTNQIDRPETLQLYIPEAETTPESPSTEEMHEVEMA